MNVPKRDVASRVATAIAAAAKADPWEEGGALSGALNPRYAKIRDVLQEQQQQSRVARRRGGRRRDDLKDSAYKMPQIVDRAGARELQARGVVREAEKGVCRQTKMRKPILYKRRLKLPPFQSRPLVGGCYDPTQHPGPSLLSRPSRPIRPALDAAGRLVQLEEPTCMRCGWADYSLIASTCAICREL